MTDPIPAQAPASGDDDTAAAPPIPERRPVELTAHGDVRVDDWYWLRDATDPAVIEHLRAENAYTETSTARLAGLREALYEEIVARIEETDLSVPARKGPWWYYQRTVEGRDYRLLCRCPASGDEPPAVASDGTLPGERVLLDENAEAEGHPYFALGVFDVSPDHRLLAYSVDATGGERHTLRFRDLERGVDLPEAVEDTSYGSAWVDDDTTFLYVRVDEAMRPFQLWRHTVGTDPTGDVLVHEEPDEHFYLGVHRTRDDCFVVLTLESKVTSELHLLRTGDAAAGFDVVEPRRHGIEYALDHDRDGAGGDGRLLITTNDGAEDFRLMECPPSAPGRDNWREVIPHRAGTRLEGAEAFAGHLVVYERDGGDARARVVDRASGSSTPVDRPEEPSTVWPGTNPEYDSDRVRYEYSSLATPRAVIDLDTGTGTSTVRKRQPVLGDFDRTRYHTERRWAVAGDGTRVPMSLVWRSDRHRGGVPEGAPCLLYGYGSYEASIDPVFSSLRLSLVDRGFVFAIAHVRGGGEMGRRWYEDGKLEAKPHTFSDFVACARALVDDGTTSPDRLVARGGSAGGLLMGAVANMAPELFRAIVAEVPFVDCLTTILDDTLPLTVLEWEEWGNPVADPHIYDVMKSYSPYDNVRAIDPDGTPVRYPDILATGGLTDPRVGFWEPAKWVARLRTANPENRVLLKMELDAGHAGPSGRYDAWRDEAFVYAFILDAVGAAG